MWGWFLPCVAHSALHQSHAAGVSLGMQPWGATLGSSSSQYSTGTQPSSFASSSSSSSQAPAGADSGCRAAFSRVERAEIAQIRADKKAAEDKRVRDFENFIADARAAKAADDAAKGLSFSGDRIVDPNRPAGDENADPNSGGATARFDEATYVDADELD